MTIARKRYIADVSHAAMRYAFTLCVGCGEDLADSTASDAPFYRVQVWRPPVHEIGAVSGAHITYEGRWDEHARYCETCWDEDRRRSIGPRRLWFYHRKYLSNPWNPLPYRGGDEYGRRTLAVRVWGGTLVVAFGKYRTPNTVDAEFRREFEGAT